MIWLIVACGSAAVPPPAVIAADCPTWTAPKAVGELDDGALSELSDLAARPGGYWAHNDSGDTARFFALDETAHHVATIDLSATATAVDWEDMAVYTPASGARVLFLGDTGDNEFVRAHVTVYHLNEPAPVDGTAAAVGVDYTYPDGQRLNAEALLVDSRDGALYVVTKSNDGTSHVFVDRAPMKPGPRVWEAVGTLRFGGDALPGSPKVTSGDLAADGRAVMLRTYESAYWWRIAPAQTVMDALKGPPCVVPASDEKQGESLAFLPDGGFATISEGKKSTLWRATLASGR